MTDPAEQRPGWWVNLIFSASESVHISDADADTAEAAEELAYDRSRASLCHQCGSHLDLGDPHGVLIERHGVEVVDTVEDDLRRRESEAVKAALERFADALVERAAKNGAALHVDAPGDEWKAAIPADQGGVWFTPEVLRGVAMLMRLEAKAK